MYEAYWGLQEKPFENTPHPRFLYQSGGDAVAERLLYYALENNRGAALLTGDSGCGKTPVTRALIQDLDPAKTEIALLTNPRWTPKEFISEILCELGHEEELLVYFVHPAITEGVLKKITIPKDGHLCLVSFLTR